MATSLLKPRRVQHVLGCAKTAKALAERYGADPVLAERAGLLHDITKAMDGPDQLLLLDEYDIIVSDFERNHPKLLHAKTGAGVAQHLFGECDQVVSAIYWHTTGNAGYGADGEDRLYRRLYGAHPEFSRGGGTAQGGICGSGPGPAQGL